MRSKFEFGDVFPVEGDWVRALSVTDRSKLFGLQVQRGPLKVDCPELVALPNLSAT